MSGPKIDGDEILNIDNVASARGRIDRTWYAIGTVALGIGSVITFILAGLGNWLLWATFVIVFWMLMVSLPVLRLHDIGRSGWFVLCLLVPSFVCTTLQHDYPDAAGKFIDFDRPILLFWQVLELAVWGCLLFWPGMRGPNRFGAGPMRLKRAEPASSVPER